MATLSPTAAGLSEQLGPELFTGIGNPKAEMLWRILENAGPFAKIDAQNREIVIGREALLKAAALFGHDGAEHWTTAIPFSTMLGIDPKLARELKIAQDHGRGAVEQALSEGFQAKLSSSVMGTVVKRARFLAKATVNREIIDTRHLLLALLDHDGPEWMFLPHRLTRDDLLQARLAIVDEIAKHPERGENVDRLRKMVSQQPAEHGSDAEERLPAQRDEPAQHDRLNRLYFARVLAQRLVEVRSQQERSTDDEDRAFVVHLDGQWGSGKSTVLNFVIAELQRVEPSWVIVRFNAWREQGTKPPWWAIMSQTARQLLAQVTGRHWWSLAWTWLWWQLRTRWAAVALVLTLVAAALWYFPQSVRFKAWGITEIAGLLAAAGAIFAFLRTITLGSAQRAQAINALGGDPYAPVIATFNKLIRRAGRPVLVLVDDIDRCTGDNVVSLLESIQTALRQAPVTYLVAGDRKWITTAFEKSYADFCAPLECSGRSLGYMFLEKLFQLSVAIPQINGDMLERYWAALLSGTEPVGPAETAAAAAEAESAIGALSSQEGLQRAIDEAEASGNVDIEMAVRGAAALKIASPAGAEILRHRFGDLAPLLEHNPRAIKRLINALGVNQAVLFLEGRKADPELLARWTIIELRWPQLADALVQQRQWLDAPETAKDPWRELLASPEVKAVRDGSEARLTTAALNALIGHAAVSAAAA